MKNSVVLFIFSLALVLLGFNGFNAEAQRPADYDVLVSQGNSQLQSGNNEQALASAASAIKVNADRWEAYAVAGGALLNLKRYEEAADQFSHAIDYAPEAKQEGLRILRKECLSAELGSPSSPSQSVSSGPSVPPSPGPSQSASTSQAEIVLWKTIENSTNPADFQSYLTQYPNGAFVVLARRHLDEAEAARVRLLQENPAEHAAMLLKTGQNEAAQSAILHIIRDSSRGQIPAYILVDRHRRMEVMGGQNVKIVLSSGKHTISVEDKAISGSELADLAMEGGKEYWVRLSVSVGLWKPHSKLTVEPSQAAQDESIKLVEINFGNDIQK
jgi:tetratricopeptide (TPR) repeat protein